MSSKTFPILAITVAIVSGLFVHNIHAQINDQIYTQGGTPTRGDISSATPNDVIVVIAGSERKIPTNTIRKVNFGGEPAELRTARGHIDAQRYEDAIEALNKIDPKSLTRKLIAQDFIYLRALANAKLALAGGGDKAAAETALLGFMTNHASQSYHAYECAETLGDIAVSMQEHEKAAKYYRYLEKSPWKDYLMKSSVLQASALLGQEKYAEAQTKFDAVVASTLDDAAAQEQKRLATVGKALCLAETGNPAGGIKLVEGIINSNDPKQNRVLFGRAYNALGRCYYKQDNTKQALLSYLHVHLLFFSESETHAEALYHLGKLWAKVKKSDRAIQAKSRLNDTYAGSAWAKKA